MTAKRVPATDDPPTVLVCINKLSTRTGGGRQGVRRQSAAPTTGSSRPRQRRDRRGALKRGKLDKPRRLAGAGDALVGFDCRVVKRINTHDPCPARSSRCSRTEGQALLYWRAVREARRVTLGERCRRPGYWGSRPKNQGVMATNSSRSPPEEGSPLSELLGREDGIRSRRSGVAFLCEKLLSGC